MTPELVKPDQTEREALIRPWRKGLVAGGPWQFDELVALEFQRLHPDEKVDVLAPSNGGEAQFRTAPPGPADEPWVSFTRHDHFGIALSGGGIRSATFNLGLLQGLAQNDVLDHVDYLSTVSGGGYIGGFWTAWLHHEWEKLFKAPVSSNARESDKQAAPIQPQKVESIFPRQQCQARVQAAAGVAAAEVTGNGNGHDPNSGGANSVLIGENRESGEIRHLREFSRFLMPRVGFGHSETWSGIITVLAGLIPSLLGTTALAVAGVYAWLLLNYLLLFPDAMWMVAVVALATVLGQGWGEWLWRRRGRAGDAQKEGVREVIFLIVLTGSLTAFWWWHWLNAWRETQLGNNYVRWLSYWRHQMPQPGQGGHYTFNAVLLVPAVAWSSAAVCMMVLRFFSSRWILGRAAVLPIAALDRCTYRCLAPAVVWAGVAGCWEIARRLYWSNVGQGESAGGAVLFGGLFLWLRHWLFAPLQESRGTRLFQRAVAVLKPLTPQLLAYASVVSFSIAIMLLIQSEGLHWGAARWFVGLSIIFLLVLLVCFNPAAVGLHDFYRARIARCFLGAARASDAMHNRATFEQQADDFDLCDRPEVNLPSESKQPGAPVNRMRYHGRPIHLICCAANNLAGDTLSSLYRGCRSAVLSPHGISLGNYTAPLLQTRFSSALTASAAAFNSQMGRVSMNLGPAVAIIMSALNFRLGLWVPHPLNPSRKPASLPGRFFLYEMFGYTRCDEPAAAFLSHWQRMANPAVALWEVFKARLATSRHIHLSDGAHFENLGLYELVRRRCRYIIVSDCSADPQVGFDDLANALRCVREDFGVEIELDVAPLRPSGGRSAQHAVIGTIHYDGLNGNDKGTLLYFKPTLTGDEPPDVLQYYTRNPAFPHESTGDQFYDEAQWESYRRLGEHAANVVLRFLQAGPKKRVNSVENLFLDASQRWHPAPARQEETFLQLTQRCADLEADVRDHAPLALRLEFFPEIAACGLAPEPSPSPEDETKVVYYVMLAAQLMEDTWLSAQLETYWSHPLNEGWMAYFQRWASTDSFRRWWPLVRSLYSSGFADFVKERFDLRLHDYEARPETEARGAELKLSGTEIAADTPVSGLAWQRWVARYGVPDRRHLSVLTYDLHLDPCTGRIAADRLKPIQVGFVLFQKSAEGIVQWTTPHLFVPDSLIGAGILARFLDALIARFLEEHLREIQVILEERPVPSADSRENDDGGGDGDQAKPRRDFRRDPASRYQRVHTINFYKSRGFVYLPPSQDGQLRMLSLDLVRLRKSPVRSVTNLTGVKSPVRQQLV